MVRRKLNVPAVKIGKYPIFWLREVMRSKWNCMQCHTHKQEGEVAFEVFVREARKMKKEDLEEVKKLKQWQGMKKYICLDCAEDMLGEALQEVKICKLHGPEGYQLLKKM